MGMPVSAVYVSLAFKWIVSTIVFIAQMELGKE
jgi:hypothetical protein